MSNVAEVEFDGIQAVEITTAGLRLVATRDFGPRIASLGKPDGDNILLWDPETYTRGDWDLRGGHRVWVARPMADECEDTYATDNGPCELEIIDGGFRLTGTENPANCTRRGFAVRVLNDTTLEVDNFVTNTGEMLYSGALWALTCSLPSKDTRYGIPIGNGSEWDAFTLVSFRRWGGHGEGGFEDPQVTVSGDLMIVDPAGVENKRMLMSHHGIIAMCDAHRSLTFAKKVASGGPGSYPLNCNMAFYVGPDNFMVEMETLGTENTLRPGESLHHLETWVLQDGAASLNSAQTLVDLFA